MGKLREKETERPAVCNVYWPVLLSVSALCARVCHGVCKGSVPRSGAGAAGPPCPGTSSTGEAGIQQAATGQTEHLSPATEEPLFYRRFALTDCPPDQPERGHGEAVGADCVCVSALCVCDPCESEYASL